jgi:hypothetical protein
MKSGEFCRDESGAVFVFIDLKSRKLEPHLLRGCKEVIAADVMAADIVEFELFCAENERRKRKEKHRSP